MSSARGQGIARCHDCGLAARVAPSNESGKQHCPRCNATLHLRKRNSISRTWALVIAGYLMYIPANVLPVSTIVYLGDSDPDTIMSGVRSLLTQGDVAIALLLFTASIVVPILKLVVLTVLLISIHLRVRWRPRDRTVLYRVLEIIGRWSMLDVFVIALLVATVQLQEISTVYAGPGAIAFGAVVLITIFATESFDPRLMWDALEEEA